MAASHKSASRTPSAFVVSGALIRLEPKCDLTQLVARVCIRVQKNIGVGI
jgi:hypothetical protein